jgi:hypothetical protein
VQSALDELQDKKLNVADLAANVVFYPTSANSDIATYFKLAASTDDADYDDPAVDISTGTISGSDQFIAALASEAGILVGATGVISISTVGNVRRVSGFGQADFYFEVYKRDSGGTETLMGTSNSTPEVGENTYEQFFAECLITSTTFAETDRIVFKYYGNRTGGVGNSEFEFQFGGSAPVRSNLPVPVNVVSHANDAEDILVDTAGFNGILSGADDDVQSALETLDDHAHDGRYYTESEIGAFFDGNTAITGYNKSDWDTAFSWGDHSAEDYATTSYVDTAVANLVDSAPAALDTLNELAAALGDDANFSTTVTNSIATKQDAATALTTSTTFGGDVSGTYNAIVIANDSHNHDGRYYTEAESDARLMRSNADDDFTGTLKHNNVGDTALFVRGGNVDTTLIRVSSTNNNDAENSLGSYGFSLRYMGSRSGNENSLSIFADNQTSATQVESLKINQDGVMYRGTNRLFDDGYHPNADKWTTARTLSLTGAVTGSASIDGSGNVSLATTNTADPTLTLAGDASGSATFTNLGNATLTVTVADDSHNHVISNVDGLQTALDGKLGSTEAAVSADKWTTARTVSLTGAVTGSASVDGSANVSIATTHTADPTITLTGAVTGSGTMTNLGNVSIATTATADPTLTLTGDVTGSATFTNLGNATLTATVANDSHSHAFNNLTAKTSGTGDYKTTGRFRSLDNIVSGEGSGGVALTINDSKGNANVTWNHENGVPEQTGNAARVEVNTDSTTGAAMYFELKSGVTGGTSVDLNNIMTLTESAITAESGIAFTGSGSGLTGTASSLSIGGNAATASKWATARTLSLTGAVTGSASIDGSGNVSLATTATSDPTLTLSGDASGSATFTNLGNATLTVTVADDSHNHVISNVDGLQTALDGKLGSTANAVSASKWATARTLTLNGDVSGSVSWDGSANATLTATVADDSHNHVISNVDGLQTALDAKMPIAGGTFTGNITAPNMYVNQYIYHNGDTNTYIDFQADRMRIVAGGVEMIDNIEGGTDYVQIANAQFTVYTAGNAALTGSLTYNPDGGSVTTETNEGSVNYVYNSTGGTPTRGACGVHVYQQWSNNLSLALTDASWVQGDIVRVSNAKGSANITVSATRIYLPDGTYDTSVTYDGTVGGFVLAKYSTTQGYWMVMP